MSKEVFEKAAELGKSIIESEEFKNVQQAERAMIGDPNAQSLLKRFHELQQLQKEKQKKGESMTPDETREFEQVQLKFMENRTIKAFSDAQNTFQEMMNQVMKIIKDAGVNAVKK
ncbi:YlbF family regulator [Desulfallas sp. Bu1-1]|uniref:YlbF family regulator n=1 Tax=Desulfallas sp. Bu1-1 TaxID=2787620 RepID=UPI00189F25B0|nr:YlbF family regulator [Desulfallas sp. Bu1-1]MBF7083874.1 YlbF family regulator [Desulfallas sp. Bu1-1]